MIKGVASIHGIFSHQVLIPEPILLKDPLKTSTWSEPPIGVSLKTLLMEKKSANHHEVSTLTG